MARRRRGTDVPPRRGRPKAPPDYYAHTEADLRYIERVEERMRARTRRVWLIRLAVLVVLVLIARFWGPTAVRAFRGEARQTIEEFKGVSRHIQEGRDRRSGANFDENNP
jgi:hypothetical protein